MTDFLLRIVADPARAVSDVDRVEKKLEAAEIDARALGKAIADAMALKNDAVVGGIDRVSDRLRVARDHAVVTQAELAALGDDVKVSQINKFNSELDKTEDKAANLRSLFGGLFAGITFGTVLSQFVQLSDASTNLRNKLSAVTDSESELISVQNELLAVSNRTRSSFEGAAAVFSRLAANREDLKRSNGELLNFTESLQKAIALSGATAQEAENGLIQLAQGMAAGALRGDELRSVLEQLPVVADVIAEGLGVTRGQLRKLGEQGAITSDVILKAFAKASQELNEKFAKTIPTIAQSMQVLKNNAIELTGSFNQTTYVSQAMSLAIQLVGDNLGTASIAVSAFATLLTYNLAAKAIPAAIAALSKLGIAATAGAGPFVALGVAAIAATTYIAGLIDAENKAVEAANKGLEEDGAFASIGTQVRQARQELALLQSQMNIDPLGTGSEEIGSEGQRRRVAELTATIEKYTQASRDAASVAAEQDLQAARNSESVKALVRELNAEATTLALSNDEQEIRKRLLKETEELSKKGVDLNAAGNAALRDEVDGMLRRNQEVARQADILEKIRGPQEQYRKDIASLTALLAAGKIEQDEFNRAVAEATPKADKDTFTGRLQILREENEELAIKAANEGAVEEALLAELDLRRGGVDLTTEQSAALLEELKRQKELNDAIAAQRTVAKVEKKADDKEERAIEQLRKRIDVTGQLALEEQRLQDLLALEPALADQISVAMDDLRLRQLQAATDLGSGFERAFLKIKKEAEDLAAIGEQITDVFVGQATDAIVEFAETGVFNFKKFASSVLADITRIIVRLLVVKAIEAGLSAVGGGVGTRNVENLGVVGNSQPAFLAEGGPARAGEPYIVGEREPEIFFPRTSGQVEPVSKLAASLGGGQQQQAPPQPAPQVNLRVINKIDDNYVADIIDSGLADESLVNMIARRRSVIDIAR